MAICPTAWTVDDLALPGDEDRISSLVIGIDELIRISESESRRSRQSMSIIIYSRPMCPKLRFVDGTARGGDAR